MRDKNIKDAVYNLLPLIPRGTVVSYGQIADMLGNRRLSRVVGNILHRNTDGEKYPCYKVLRGDGRLSEAYAFGGIEEQKRRLEADGIEVVGYKVDMKKYRYNFLKR